MTTPYVYHPLDKATQEIRLVDILPSADFDAPIELTISHAPFVAPPEHLLVDGRPSLNDIDKTLPPDWKVEKSIDGRHLYGTYVGDDIRTSWSHPVGHDFGEPPRIPPAGFQPQFEALSWTWGDSIDTQAGWVVDGEGNKSTFQLRKNLAEAIRYLRQPDQPRRMWIDSICIDQENMPERGQQVLRMTDLYRLAHRVVIWLGPAGLDTRLAFEGLHNLGERIEVTQADLVLPPPLYTGDYPWEEITCGVPFSEATWSALDDILARFWFGRVWTIQEHLLANTESIFVCGSFTILSVSFQKACASLYRPWTTPASFNRPLLTRAMRRISLQNTPVSNLLVCAKEMACTNERDRVYGLLGLMPRRITGGIQPDYAKSTPSQVFTDMVLQHGTTTRRLGLLDLCDLGTKLPDAPSWVPNFSTYQPWINQSCTISFASGYFPSFWTSNVADGTLDVDGVRCGTVAEVSSLLDSEQSAVAFFWRAFQGQVEGIPKATHARDYAYAYHDGELDDFIPGRDFPTLEQATSTMLEMVSGNNAPTSLTTTSLAVNAGFSPFTFFYTDVGLAGFTYCSVQPADLLVVIPGCLLPKIVRPLASSPKAYQLVGSCSILDLANAEALLGPLPKGFTAKYSFDYQGGPQTWIVNEETGAQHGPLYDPRMEPLPAEWGVRRLSGEGEERNEGFPLIEFVHRQTGETRRIDPRCTREALVARGVAVETFELR